MGAVNVLETAPETPPRRRSVPILRIMIDPKRILTKKYLGDQPCLKGEHQ